MSERRQIRVGIGGWVFPPWRGVFYPLGLPQARELGYASRQLTTIEINGTFYGPQKPASFRRWHDETPEDFVFSIKGPRVATHRPDLAGAGSTLDRFFSSGVFELRDGNFPLRDSDGNTINAKRRLVAQLTIKDGRVWYERPSE